MKRKQFWGEWLLGLGLPSVGFAILAIGVWYHGQGFLWDIPVLQALHTTARPEWEPFVRGVTKLGVLWGVFPVATTIALLMIYQKRWRSFLYLVITLSSSSLLNRIAKLLMHRERPNLWEAFSPELDYAFPSGHAMSSMTLVVVLVLLAWSSRWCWWALVLGSVYVGTIGWTRLYLGVHYPSDILAGWLLALAWAVGLHWVMQLQSWFNDPPDYQRNSLQNDIAQ
jgi:undecaprenyl-diphosphatase